MGLNRRPAPLIAEPRAQQGPDTGLDMLDACHGRVQHQCATLRRLLEHVPHRGADAEARQAAGTIIRYFETASRQHHADEETDLMPALLAAAAAADREAIRQLGARLAAEHRELERLWQPLHAQLLRLATGEAGALQHDTLLAFVERSEAHVATEDEQLLPLARRLLGADALALLSGAMRRRRGLAPQ